LKIDRKNIKHWVYLLVSTSILLILIPLRPFRSRRKKHVVFYGHKLNGNIKSFVDYLNESHPELEKYVLTLDPDYYKELSGGGSIDTLSAYRFRDVYKVVTAEVVITDHGLHVYELLKFTNIKLVDIWHGIPFKGYDIDNFKDKHKYAELWTNSEWMADKYVKDFGFRKDQVFVTGYSRVDKLVTGGYSKVEILDRYGIKKSKKIVLFAPTWKQDDLGRSILPFDQDDDGFFGGINSLASKYNFQVIFRAHLNSGQVSDLDKYENIKVMSYKDYPIAEEFLFVSDVLITDWSSICFDFLPLKRPTIFLDVPAPFSKGYTLGPEYRFGMIAGSMEQLLLHIGSCVNKPSEFEKKYAKNIKNAEKVVYGDTLDGKSSERYYKRLEKLLK